ncbi:MAG: hypothetical protein LBM75_01255 [Myxococcales bacterium]|jgi:hypothetical protein|nr:hypothetical protein [Myxococcales bacterium]
MGNESLDKAVQAKFKGKNLSCARQIRKQLGLTDEDKPNEKSLAIKIGELIEQKSPARINWWRTHPNFLKTLCELVGLSEDEILSPPDNLIQFREFPELTPISINDGLEPIWKPHSSNSIERPKTLFEIVANHLTGKSSFLWLCIPPGGGKTLTIQMLQKWYSNEVHACFAKDLTDIECTPANALPFICSIDSSNGNSLKIERKIRTLKSHSNDVVILAPFKNPIIDESLSYLKPSLISEWRERLLGWMDGRIRNSLRPGKWNSEVKERILEWIQKSHLDPFVRTPGELIALCAEFYRDPEQEIFLYERAVNWMNSQFSHNSTMIQKNDLEIYRKSISQLFKNRALCWEKISFKEIFDSLKSENENKDQTAQRYFSLKEMGWLRSAGEGFEVFPSWVSAGILSPEESEKLPDLDFDDAKDWGWAAADHSRSQWIDYFLSEHFLKFDPDKLKKFFDSLDSETLEGFAALETLIFFIGNHSDSWPKNPMKSKKLVNAIPWNQFFENLENYGIPLVGTPFKFPLLGTEGVSSCKRLSAFLKMGWTISLNSEKPEGVEIPEIYRWIFPGWNLEQLRLSEIYPSSGNWWIDSDDLFELSIQLLEKMTNLELPESVDDTPALFIPALLLSEKEWPLPKNILEQQNKSADKFLKRNLSGKDTDFKRKFSQKFWRLLDGSPKTKSSTVAGRISWLSSHHRSLVQTILETLPLEALVQTSKNHGLWEIGTNDPKELSLLPTQTRLGLIQDWILNSPKQASDAFQAEQLLPFLTPEIIEENEFLFDGILEALRTANTMKVYEFAAHIWRIHPEKALNEAERLLKSQETSDNARAWFERAPVSHWSVLAQLIRQNEFTPDWAKLWCQFHLKDAGSAADDLFELMKEISGKEKQIKT